MHAFSLAQVGLLRAGGSQYATSRPGTQLLGHTSEPVDRCQASTGQDSVARVRQSSLACRVKSNHRLASYSSLSSGSRPEHKHIQYRCFRATMSYLLQDPSNFRPLCRSNVGLRKEKPLLETDTGMGTIIREKKHAMASSACFSRRLSS